MMNNLAYALARSGRRKEAIAWLDRAIAADDHLADAYYHRAAIRTAVAAESGGDVPESAIRDIEAAVKLAPNDHWAAFAAARIFAWRSIKTDQSGHRAKAIECLLQSLRLGFAPNALPTGGPLGEISREIRRSEAFAAAVEIGSRASLAPTLGFVDSLAGMD